VSDRVEYGKYSHSIMKKGGGTLHTGVLVRLRDVDSDGVKMDSSGTGGMTMVSSAGAISCSLPPFKCTWNEGPHPVKILSS